MIVISLDEGGRFELISKPQCMLIGGVIFQCEQEQDINKERRSLEDFFKTICNEQGCNYPYDLHYNWQNGSVVNAESAEKVKNALTAELPDYLKKRGRWTRSRPQKSSYYVFCMVGDKTALANSASNLRDDVAAIRYEHMVYRTIENLLFFNPLFRNETEIKLHLPTRVIKVTDPAMQQEMKELGYRKHQSEQTYDPDIFHVTDESGFRTCLESALLNSDRDDLIFDLMVQSIKYETPQFHQMFLYLADTMCSVWQEAIHGLTAIDEAMPLLKACGDNLVYSGNTLLWAYNHSDQKWRSCWSDFRHGNWFDALKSAGEIRTSQSAACQAYKEIWIGSFEQALTESTDFPALSEAFYRLDQYMLDLEKRRQGTGLYIMNLLQKNFTQIKDEHLRGKLEYRVSKILTGLYNHNGDHVRAREEYEKCVRAARYVPIEEFLGLQLMHSTSLSDAGLFEEAEKIAAELVSHHELLNEIKESVYPDNRMIYDSYARALSQHGQCLAFLERYDEAVQRFRQALKIFEKDSRDWQMTGSFLLHALIEQDNREDYDQFARIYFKSGSPRKQFNNIKENKCGNIPFALYLFLKGLWVFSGTEAENIKEILEKTGQIRMSADPHHPWEQIMKYCAFLWCRYFEDEKDHSRSRELMDNGAENLKNATGILKIIGEDNELQYQNVISGRDYTTGSKLHFTYR